MRLRFATTAALAMASCSRTVAAAALEGGGTTCARPASFPSAVANTVNQQLSGPIPVEVPSQLKISFDKKSLNGKVRDMTMLLFCVMGRWWHPKAISIVLSSLLLIPITLTDD
jgi:hypothetical protein